MKTAHTPELGSRTSSTMPSVTSIHLAGAWQDVMMNFALLMKAFRPEAAWLERLEHTSERVRALLAQDADVALYVMLQEATSEVEHYSAHHALFCAIVSSLCSAWFDWPAEERQALFSSALTMNLGMLSIQDSMARQSGALSADQRKRVDEHAAHGVELLRSAGVADKLWLDIVLRHHKPIAAGDPSDPIQAAQRLAQLLHRVDVFTAKLSRRENRAATSPTIAARDACLDGSGIPDAIGATIIRVLGLYPPGSFVRLVSGELAVVTRRGSKAHTPIVACLRRANGTTYGHPHRRDTSEMAYAVQRATVAAEVKLFINHERVLAA